MTSMLQLFNGVEHQRPVRAATPAAATPSLGVSVEVKEDKNSMTFLASLPAYRKDDIKVSCMTPFATVSKASSLPAMISY